MARPRPNPLFRQRVSLRSVVARELRGFAVRTLRGLGDAPAILSASQIQLYAANAGFSGADLATAVAVALAESLPSGNPNSYNPERQKGTPPGQGSYGLWQIYLWKHPEFASWNLLDPQANANAAFSIYQQAGGFTPWSTYNSGAYRAYLTPISPAAPPPLTIDATTGQPIEDQTPTPVAAGVAQPSKILGLTLVGLAAYLAADYFFGD